jgi:hypothetical protein
LEQFNEKELNISTLMKIYFKPEYSNLFKKIKGIRTPVKNDILMALLDGRWHSENELIKVIKKKFQYVGSVTLASMTNALNNDFNANNYLQKKISDGKVLYKLSDNYIGLTRAAFTKYRFAEM